MNTLSSIAAREGRRPLLAAGAATLTILSWASAFPFIQIGLRSLTPMQLAAARFATAAVLVLVWFAWRRPRRPTGPDTLHFLLCALLGIVLYNALLNTGEQTVTPGAASFIAGTMPLFTALLAFVFLRERFNRRAWLGSLLSLAGIAIIAHGQPGGLALGSGSTLILGAALSTAGFFVLQRRLIRAYGALASSGYTLLAGALLFLPWLPGALGALASAPGSVRAAVLMLGIFPAALGYAAWTVTLDHFGAARAANFLYLTPAVATAFSMALTGERPGLSTLLGGLLTIAGVAFAALNARA